MVELPGGNWWTRDVAQRLVGRHLTTTYSEQRMDKVGYARKCGKWHTLKLALGNLFGQKRRGLSSLEYWVCVKKKQLPEIPQEFRRNSAGMSLVWLDPTTLPRGE